VNELDCLDYVYDETTTNENIFARDLRPLVAAFVEGISCGVVAAGATGTGKSYSLDGSGTNVGMMYLIYSFILKTLQGLVQLICENIFVAVNERIGRAAGRLTSTVSIQYPSLMIQVLHSIVLVLVVLFNKT